MYRKEPGKKIGEVENHDDILRVIQLTVSEMKDVVLIKKVFGILERRIRELEDDL